MRGSRISNTVTSSVTLGSGGYASPLIVTSTGSILVSDGIGDAAVTAQMAGVHLTNHGMILGSSAGYYQMPPVGGDGVYFAAGGSVTNTGTIGGGMGADNVRTAPSINGGIGVDLAGSGGVLNDGTIYGGEGGSYEQGSTPFTASGGIGVYLQDGGRVSNNGTIQGGNGSNYRGTAGTGVSAIDARLVNAGLIEGGTQGEAVFYNVTIGGVGIDLQGGSLANAGTVIGGAGSYEGNGYGFPSGVGGIGLEISAGSTATNTGTITGGAGATTFRGQTTSGGIGVDIIDHGTLINHALISGGATPTYAGEYGNGANGAGGVYGGSASIVNTGIISGSIGANANGSRTDYGRGGTGGTGVDLSGAGTITNHGGIYGGVGGAASFINSYGYGAYGGAGGAGIDFRASGTLTNSGTISAGAGGETTYYAHPRSALGVGGIGVDLQSGGSIVNTGLIRAGAGGFGHDMSPGADGGIGLNMAKGGTLTNSGSIIAGAGGASDGQQGGNGGAGVYLNGGTLTNSGTITGGAGGMATINGTAGDAVQFGTLAATLVVEAGAVFNGRVVADLGAKDRLELGGTTPGTFTGLGSAFTRFTTVEENAGSTWTLTGTNTLLATGALLVDGMLSVSGTLTNAGSTTIATHAILAASEGADILLAGVDLAGGRLLGSSTATFSIGTQAGGIVGGLTVQSGAEILGYGAIDAGGVIVDNGEILAQGGTLTIGQPITGSGSLEIGAGATAITGGAVELPAVVFASGGSGTFDVDVPLKMSADISGFGNNDVIDLKNLVANTLSFMSGTLTLDAGGKVVDTLVFQGSYTTANFQLTSDGQGGSDISFVANGDLAHSPWLGSEQGPSKQHYSASVAESVAHFASWPLTEGHSVFIHNVAAHGR